MTNCVALSDGTTLAVRSTGDAGSPTIVWGHGLTSSMASEDAMPMVDWSAAAPHHRIVRYDARGHGQSESTDGADDYRWDRLALDQLALADALGIDRYVAAGASMGAATALHAALAAPERIDRLVLAIPPTAWETRAEQTDLYSTMADLVDAGQIELLVTGVDQVPAPDPFAGDDRWRARSKETLSSTEPVRLARVLRGAGRADLPSHDALQTIPAPTLLLAWSGDPGHPVSTAERLHDLLPASTLHVASTPDELASWSHRIADFLDG